jgi:hypothetical protein
MYVCMYHMYECMYAIETIVKVHKSPRRCFIQAYYEYMYAYIPICLDACIHLCEHERTYVYVCRHVYLACMLVHIYANMYVCVCVYVHMHTNVFVCLQMMYQFIYVGMYVCMHAYQLAYMLVYIYANVCVCVYVCMYVCMHTDLDIYTKFAKYKHIYIYSKLLSMCACMYMYACTYVCMYVYIFSWRICRVCFHVGECAGLNWLRGSRINIQ